MNYAQSKPNKVEFRLNVRVNDGTARHYVCPRPLHELHAIAIHPPSQNILTKWLAAAETRHPDDIIILIPVALSATYRLPTSIA